jgi:hypothetical protein
MDYDTIAKEIIQIVRDQQGYESAAFNPMVSYLKAHFPAQPEAAVDDLLLQEIYSLREKLKIAIAAIKADNPGFDDQAFIHQLNSVDFDQLMEELSDTEPQPEAAKDARELAEQLNAARNRRIVEGRRSETGAYEFFDEDAAMIEAGFQTRLASDREQVDTLAEYLRGANRSLAAKLIAAETRAEAAESEAKALREFVAKIAEPGPRTGEDARDWQREAAALAHEATGGKA